METEIRIREAGPDEHDSVAALYLQAYAEFAHALGPDRWQAMRTNLELVEARAAYSTILVAERAGALLGAVMYTAPNVRPGGGIGLIRFVPAEWAYLGILGVDPATRGRGIGRALSGACVALARRDGGATIGLVTREIMSAARRLYDGMGFLRRPDLDAAAGPGFLVYALPLGRDL
ncbi:MAG TPA: GNAT family N-acetyltransferase [Actinomycetota bacterium]|nr:GNAT family N-acetyltransferase [Actinomycetota bacterium]